MGRGRVGLVSGVWVLLLFVSVFGVVLNVRLVWGSGTIYIRADGSVYPSTAPISTTDNVTYTFTDNINDSIVIQRDNIVVDGAGYTLSGTGSGIGIDLSGRSNVSIRNMEIRTFYYGIYLYYSSNNCMSGNNITANNYYGIWLYASSNYNSISGNNITNNSYGIGLSYSSGNSISGNNITYNSYGILVELSPNSTISGNKIETLWGKGLVLYSSPNSILSGNNITINNAGVDLEESSNIIISKNNIIAENAYGLYFKSASNITLSGNNITKSRRGVVLVWFSNSTISGNNITNNLMSGLYLYDSSNNKIFHNNFINNTDQVFDVSWVAKEVPPSINAWDDNYPSGGNYWSNYLGVDLKSGSNQDQPGSDGIGDIPYIIDDHNRDRYPLILQPEKPPQPQLVSIAPNRGGNTGTVTVKIEGIGFSEVAAVRLVREGYAHIDGIDTTVVGITHAGTTLISTRFNLVGREPGLWDVVVTLPDSTELRLPEAFTIVPGGQPKLWVYLAGRFQIRFGWNATFWIIYGNDGEIDAFDINLVIRIPAGLKFKVNISPPNVSGVDWKQVPLGSLAGSQRVISIWIYSVPTFSTRFISFTVQAPSTPVQLRIGAELWQSQPNKFTQTGDFAFANETSIFSRLVNTYPILLAANFTTMPTTDFANGLLTWLQTNQNEIRLIPYAFLSVAAATEVLGTPIPDTAIKLLIDPLAETGSPGPWYGNYLGPTETKDWDGDGKITPMDYWAPTTEEGGTRPPPRDELDRAAWFHDWQYSMITNIKTGEMGIGGIGDVWSRVGGTPQDEADQILIEKTRAFDPSTTYLMQEDPINGRQIADRLKWGLIDLFSAALTRPKPRNLADAEFAIVPVGSRDPNEKAGPSGFGSQRFVPLGRELLYVIFFENLENATAPAQKVVITDSLDEDLVWDSFSFGEVSFGNMIIPAEQEVVDLRPGANLLVKIDKTVDKTNGLVTWTFESIDPDTGLPPEDPLVGFLPPNKNPPEGEGWVMFTIKPKPDLPSGTEIRNKATIVFDVNPPMDTPEFLNTIDSQPPSSSVNALPSYQPLSFEVRWSGTDDSGSGIRDYTIYVSDNNGSYTPWIRATNQSATFTGESEHTYAFYSIAQDNVGNTEQAPIQPDTTVTIDVTPPTIGIPSREPPDYVTPDQPVKVSVNVTDTISQVKNVTLSYTINDGATWTNLPMNFNSSTGLYEATIPAHLAGTWVKYKIVAYDQTENNATLDGTEPYCVYQVIPEFPPATILPTIIILSIVALVFAKKKIPKKPKT